MTIGVQLAVYGTLAVTAGRSRELLVSNPSATALAGRIAGALLVIVAALGLWHEWRGA
jgi:threonine/homoserine/homoserine lactone efflux protein